MIIDFHAHILPGMDHGCKNLDVARQQLEMAQKANVGVIVATSHFYPHKETVDDFLMRRNRSWGQLKPCLELKDPQIILGAETLLCDGMENIEGLMKLSLGNSKTLLIEMPSPTWKNSIYDTIEKIIAIADHVVIAHVERYDPKYVEGLFELGALGQTNIEALTDFWKRRRLLNWVKAGAIVALGSDIHGSVNAYKPLDKVRRILGDNFTNIMRQSDMLVEIS